MVQKIEIFKGDDVELELLLTNNDNSPLDLTGCTVYFTVKAGLSDPDDQALLKSVVYTYDDAPSGKCVMQLPRANTEKLNAGTYNADIRLKDSGDKVTTIGVIQVKVTANVTRDV